jgi:hypothetical protein
MIAIPAGPDAFIIGHNPAMCLSTFAAIRTGDIGRIGELIFAAHWAYLAAIAGFAALIIFVGKSQKSKGAIWTGAAILVITALWAGAAWLVVTPAERLEATHRELLDALAAKDSARVMGVLAEEFQTSVLTIGSSNDVKGAIEGAIRFYPMRSSRITAISIKTVELRGTTNVTLMTEFDNSPPAKTAWRLEWNQDKAGEWKLHRAELISVNNAAPGNIKVPGIVP